LSGVAAQPVTYLTQPTNISVLAGSVAEFRATPMGTPPLTYRWYHNNLPLFDDAQINGAATTHLIISNVTFAATGDYQLRVFSPGGTTNSTLAKLVFIGTLQAQLNAATNGSIIHLDPGVTYTETLVLAQNLTLVGAWWNKPTVSGGNVGPALQVLPGANVTLRGLALRNGFNSAIGGGVLNEGTLTLEHCLVADSAALNGGGVANFGTLHLVRSAISNNAASVSGGGLYNSPAAIAFITNSIFAGNTAEQGAGIFNLGTNTLAGSLFTGNIAFGNLGNGGGLYQSSGFGKLINTTLSGNTATSWTSQSGTASGGGARATGGRLEFQFTTVVSNTATFRGGGVSAGASASVFARNSVFAGNTAPTAAEFGGMMNSEGYNLVQQTSTDLTIVGTATGNLLDMNAGLGPLRDNGGPTFTHAPTAGSPVIDAGAPPGPATDARGIARPFDLPWAANVNTGWDIGALEYVDPSLYLTLSNRTSTGFTLAWPTNAILQKSSSLLTGWTDQTNVSPLFVATINPPAYFRLHAPHIPVRLTTNNETTNGFDLSWPDFGILERAPATDGPWDPLTGLSPFHIEIIPGQNEFFRLRVIEH
jgi:hypothetical protein